LDREAELLHVVPERISALIFARSTRRAIHTSR
jgi:hypothetical protein